MKKSTLMAGIFLAAAMVCMTSRALADGTNSISATTPTPDMLTTCPVSGDKLGDMGKPYVFVYQGQEVKLCCPSCKADFDKDPAKYMKQIRAADKTAQK